MKLRWPLRVAGFGIFGMLLAAFHSMYLGATAPSPGAFGAEELFICVDESQSWVVIESSRFGIRQYTVAHGAIGYLFELGTVPDWVFRPVSGQDSISRGFGWPLPALVGTEVYANRRLMELPGYLVVRGRYWVPVRVTGGLFANAGFFGLATGIIVWLAKKALGLISKLSRIRPFACERCGYDMNGLGPKCPECGWQKR